MRVVLIGASGQLGQEFVKQIPQENLVALTSQDVDVRDFDSVCSVLKLYREWDIVINLAAYHDVNGCEDNPGQAFAVNSTGAFNVAKVARKYGLRVAFFSTDYVFGGDVQRGWIPYKESDAVAPINLYGASKVAGEHLVRAANENHLIIRTSSLFGTTTSKKGHTFPEMIVWKAQQGFPLKVVNDQIMSPTYAWELAQKTLELLKVNARGTIHVVGKGGCSWYEFACETLRLVKIDHLVIPCVLTEFPSKAQRPLFTQLISERIEKFGITPMRPWQEGLLAYLREKNLVTHVP